MRYLAPEDIHEISVPILIGAEYALPIAEGKLALKIDGTITRSTIPLVEATDVTFNITTPAVAAGQVKIVNVDLSISTNLGLFTHREVVGVVDTLDIPTDHNKVRELLGLTADELDNSEIDLEGSYLELYRKMINDFHTVRQTDAYLTKRFGDLIAIFAAIKSAPQLFIRLDKSRKTENGQFQRFADPKYFQNFLTDLDAKMSEVTNDLSDYMTKADKTLISVFNFVDATRWSVNQ